MRRPGRHLLSWMLMALGLPALLAGQTQDVGDHVDRAMQILLSSERGEGQCTDGLVALLDAIVKAARAARIAGAWPEKVTAAREKAAGGQLAQTSSLLNESYLAVHGRPFAMSPAIRSVADARAHIRQQLSSVRGLLDQGRADEAVRRMLEAAAVVVTPVER